MILFKHVLRIRQIMFKNLIILAKKKFFSTYEIIKFFSFFSYFLKCFLLHILCFRLRELFTTRQQYLHLYNMTLKKYMKNEMNFSLIEQAKTINLRFNNVFYIEEFCKFVK